MDINKSGRLGRVSRIKDEHESVYQLILRVCVRVCVCAGVCVCGRACRVFAIQDMRENEHAKIRVYRPARVNGIYRWIYRFLLQKERALLRKEPYNVGCVCCNMQTLCVLGVLQCLVECLVECDSHGDCWQRHLCRSLGAVEGEGGQQAVCSA